jgi:hypothetical protein
MGLLASTVDTGEGLQLSKIPVLGVENAALITQCEANLGSFCTNLPLSSLCALFSRVFNGGPESWAHLSEESTRGHHRVCTAGPPLLEDRRSSYATRIYRGLLPLK